MRTENLIHMILATRVVHSQAAERIQDTNEPAK